MKAQEHFPVHPSVRQPTYRHASETVRSDNDAGGKVDAERYVGRGPARRRIRRSGGNERTTD
jgi:hypothetical protein